MWASPTLRSQERSLVHSALPRWASLEHPRSCHGDKVLKAEPNVALHGCVLLPEGLGQHLQLGAHLDEAV